MGNLTVLVSSFCFILCGFMVFIFKVRRQTLDLYDAYCLLLSCYFGLYVMLYIFYSHSEGYSSLAALITTFSVLIPLFVVWLFLNIFLSVVAREKILGPLRIKSLAINIVRVPVIVPFFIIICLLAMRAYEVFAFGFGWFYDAGALRAQGYHPAYWVTSLNMIYYPFLALVIVFCYSYFLLNRGGFFSRFLCFIFLLAALALSIFFRREGVFDFFFLGFVCFVAIAHSKLFSFRALFWCALCVILLFYLIYLFQANREQFKYQSLSRILNSTEKNHYVASPGVLNFPGKVVHQIGSRYPIWMFNYKIVNGLLSGRGSNAKFGQMTYYAFRNTIPGLFWWNKKIIDIHNMPCTIYQFNCTQYDWNIYAFMLADFKWYYPLVAIAFLLFFVLSSSYFLLKSKAYPILYILLLGFILNFLLWIGQPYESIFLLYRNLAMIIVIYFVLRSIWRFGWQKRH